MENTFCIMYGRKSGKDCTVFSFYSSSIFCFNATKVSFAPLNFTLDSVFLRKVLHFCSFQGCGSTYTSVSGLKAHLGLCTKVCFLFFFFFEIKQAANFSQERRI